MQCKGASSVQGGAQSLGRDQERTHELQEYDCMSMWVSEHGGLCRHEAKVRATAWGSLMITGGFSDEPSD
jgi:hypothetical protein